MGRYTEPDVRPFVEAVIYNPAVSQVPGASAHIIRCLLWGRKCRLESDGKKLYCCKVSRLKGTWREGADRKTNHVPIRK